MASWLLCFLVLCLFVLCPLPILHLRRRASYWTSLPGDPAPRPINTTRHLLKDQSFDYLHTHTHTHTLSFVLFPIVLLCSIAHSLAPLSSGLQAPESSHALISDQPTHDRTGDTVTSAGNSPLAHSSSVAAALPAGTLCAAAVGFLLSLHQPVNPNPSAGCCQVSAAVQEYSTFCIRVSCDDHVFCAV